MLSVTFLKKQASKAYNECSVKYLGYFLGVMGGHMNNLGIRGVINKITSLPNKCPIFTIWLLSAKCNVADTVALGFPLEKNQLSRWWEDIILAFIILQGIWKPDCNMFGNLYVV